MTYCGPSKAVGLQPMPTFCVRPKTLPLGGDGVRRAEHCVQRRRVEFPVHVHNVVAADGGSPATCRGAACCAPTSMMTGPLRRRSGRGPGVHQLLGDGLDPEVEPFQST